MPRGGKRRGTPGKAYSNRTDLNNSRQPIKVAPGQAYGAAQMQREAQQVLPVAGTPVPSPAGPAPAAPGGAAAGAAAAPAGPMPGELTPLGAPSQRPGEPVTAGLPVGMGPGIEAMGGALEANDPLLQLRAVYSRFPTEELRQLIEAAEEEGL